MKKLLLILLIFLFGACSSKLPPPEITSGIRGEQLGIDKNINEDTIDQYLNRSDAVYRDMRMLIDEADYEAIGGDSYLSGYVKGFEVVSFPYICNVEGLPEEVGNTYNGNTLYTKIKDGTYISNYEETDEILAELFPKDKVIFLMCGGGGYAGMMRQLLIAKGYDENKIYNVGGYWYYKGKNAISTIKEDGTYDFNKVIYHDIDFDKLTKVEGYNKEDKEIKQRETKIIKLDNLDSLKEMENKKEDFVLLISLSGCLTCASFKPIIDAYSLTSKYKIYEISVSFVEEYLNIQYTPTLVLYKKGEKIATLKPDIDEDIKYFKDSNYLADFISSKLDY